MCAQNIRLLCLHACECTCSFVPIHARVVSMIHVPTHPHIHVVFYVYICMYRTIDPSTYSSIDPLVYLHICPRALSIGVSMYRCIYERVCTHVPMDMCRHVCTYGVAYIDVQAYRCFHVFMYLLIHALRAVEVVAPFRPPLLKPSSMATHASMIQCVDASMELCTSVCMYPCIYGMCRCR